MLNFTDVTADVYKGKLSAHGDYNMDTRHYNIYGHGDKLKASSALPNAHLHCDVDLDFTIQSKGSSKDTVTSGSFKSDKGRSPMDVLLGHYVALDLGAGYYDIEPHHTGYQGEFQTIGIEYGHAWRLWQRWRLEAFVGIGWMGTHYRYYQGNEGDTKLYYQHDGKYTWFGPTRIGVNLKYIFCVKRRVGHDE